MKQKLAVNQRAKTPDLLTPAPLPVAELDVTGTDAVLAGSLDIVYAPENAALHERIAETGCLIAV